MYKTCIILSLKELWNFYIIQCKLNTNLNWIYQANAPGYKNHAHVCFIACFRLTIFCSESDQKSNISTLFSVSLFSILPLGIPSAVSMDMMAKSYAKHPENIHVFMITDDFLCLNRGRPTFRSIHFRPKIFVQSQPNLS